MTVVRTPKELAALPPVGAMPYPSRVLLCSPEEFDVVDTKNPFMAGQLGNVDKGLAETQWHGVRDAFARAGMEVDVIAPASGLEDMVFCANQTFVGLDANGERVCAAGRMRHESRRREVPQFIAHLGDQGYRTIELETDASPFEGSGDLLWHPGQRLIWAGHGTRTTSEILPEVARVFDAPVIALELTSDHFYHLDTCLCLVDETTALVHAGGLTDTGITLLRERFDNLIEVDENEALDAMACNATACLGHTVVIQRGAPKTVEALHDRGFEVIEVDTGEFMKSGGSVFCLKQYLF